MTNEFAQLLLSLMQKSVDIIKQEVRLKMEAADAGDEDRMMMHHRRMLIHEHRIERYNQILQEAA